MTIGEWIAELANSSESTEEDSIVMQNYLRRSGYGKARVVYGVVYLTGYGYPMSIHTMAKAIAEDFEVKEGREKVVD
mgnify:CR=1 FL=1